MALGDRLDCVTYRDESGETSAFVPRGGGGPGTPLFLLPGLALDGRTFEPLAEAAGPRRCVCWNPPNDLPGQGGLAAFGRLALEHADRAGLTGRVILGGSSLGGMVAVAAAETAPERVAGVILFGVAHRWAALGLPMRLARFLHPFIRSRGYHETLARVLIPAAAGDPLRGDLREQMRHRTKPYMTSVLAALRERGGFDLRPALARLQAPLLVVHGDQDGVAPIAGVAAYEEAGATVVRLPGRGHLPYLSASAETAEAVAAFARRIDAAEAP